MNKWEITIKKVSGGFLLTIPEEVEETILQDDVETTHLVIKDRQEVIEENISFKDDENKYKTKDEEKIAMARLLEKVADYFGINYDRYDKNNLKIEFSQKGHKL